MAKGNIKTALQLAGDQHNYQKTLVLLLCLCWIEINLVLMGPTLIYMDPVFNCGQDTHTNYRQSQACHRNDCYLTDQFTLTSQLGLYCNLEWTRNIIQSVFSIGSFSGLIVMNLISDTQGRRISTILSLSITIVGVLFTIMGGIFKFIPLLVIAQFCGGFGAYAIVTLSYTLLSDFCSDTFRPKAVVLVNSAWGFSTVGLGIFYLERISWFSFLLYMILIPLVAVTAIIYKFLNESPYILMNQNNKQDALEVLTKIAIMNDRSQNIPQIREIIEQQKERSQENQASCKNVFKLLKQWKYLKPIILLTLIYGTGNINFYGISYSFNMEGLGFGYNNIISGLIEMVSFIYLNYAVDFLPRRVGIAGFYTCVLIVGMTFMSSWINSNHILGTILLSLSRTFSGVGYTLIACLQIQSFTVQIQSTAAGFIEGFSLYGAFVAPFIVDISDKIGINPLVLIAICVNTAIWPNIFLKETLIKKQKIVI